MFRRTVNDEASPSTRISTVGKYVFVAQPFASIQPRLGVGSPGWLVRMMFAFAHAGCQEKERRLFPIANGPDHSFRSFLKTLEISTPH